MTSLSLLLGAYLKKIELLMRFGMFMSYFQRDQSVFQPVLIPKLVVAVQTDAH